MSLLIIHNPVSGWSNMLHNPAWICKKILDKKNVHYVWFTTLPQEHQPFDEINISKFEKIIVIAGDGTVREIISYILQHKINIPIGIIPAGTANLLAFSLNIPLFSIRKALHLALEGKGRFIDAAFVNNKTYFLIGCGKGHDAMLMRMAQRSLKRKFGVFAYLIAGIRQIFHFRRIKYKVEIDGKLYKFKARTVLIFNLLNISSFYAKKYRIEANDGWLNVIVLQASAFWSLARMFMKLLLGKAYEKKSGMKLYRAQKIILSTKQRHIPVEIDGDVFDWERLEIKVLPKAVEIITNY